MFQNMIILFCDNNIEAKKPILLTTRPEVSEGGPAITNLIQGVAREEADIHRQIEVSMDSLFDQVGSALKTLEV